MLAAREADFCMNDLELTGRARTHIVELKSPDCSLHYETAASLLAMRDAAARSGIDLVPISSYRDFDRQVTLWNRKWRGERPLYDRAGKPLELARLSESALVDAILCWSAIPGAAATTGAATSMSSTRLQCPPATRSSCCPRNTRRVACSAA
jgi:LAS superfamily LD-carboxypeptidase LdcB